jgi:hypothetical protein
LTRLIIGIAAGAALLFAAQTSEPPQRDSSVTTFHSESTLGTFSVLHSVRAHWLALELRLPARSTRAFDAAAPVFAQAALVRDAAHNVRVVASAITNASIVGGGYDATAPPALS